MGERPPASADNPHPSPTAAWPQTQAVCLPEPPTASLFVHLCLTLAANWSSAIALLRTGPASFYDRLGCHVLFQHLRLTFRGLGKAETGMMLIYMNAYGQISKGTPASSPGGGGKGGQHGDNSLLGTDRQSDSPQ